ncbi:hypothetical protein Xsto_03897 [Xenorhabdus stockiae]|uniref:Uncharacterized protein n=1 Tax=Xenorhabdus stockiae TaxID=351614 RepID=A0A2D0KAY8_9GAMM|nr:hypothetical protein [Xenorhabdus stockiae]PHM60530.1 hypothetical protein Xsto_03897 [Xenorhabdus stockiae]
MSNKLQTAVEIAEEIKLQLIPMMVEIENEGEEDTYIMCRGIYRQMKGLIENLKEVSGGGVIREIIMNLCVTNWKLARVK